jgi:LysR family transcriptional activator of nhaA
MDWLNYHHLLYFWTVVRKGSVSKAAEELSLSQPTISAQVKLLETAIGEPLFVRKGREQVLTDVGRVVYHHADEIFAIGRDLLETLHGRSVGRTIPLTVGVANAVPKLVVYRLIKPVLQQPDAIRVICREDDPEQLVGLLATYALDVIIANAPAPTYLPVKVFNHVLGESETAFFAPSALAASLKRRFPRSLQNAPLLVPTSNSPLRRALEDWFDAERIRPLIVGEFEDSALMTVVGQAGGCVFPAPAAIERDITRFYGARMIGRTDAVRERYYVISAERRLTHPGVVAMTTAARDRLFGT